MIGQSLFAALNNATCAKDLFYGIPHWGKGLDFDTECTLKNFTFSDVWIVVANIAVIMLRVAALVAVVFVIYGGIRYITSAGNPDNTKAATGIIVNAVVGLVIAILASFIVSFIAGVFG